MRKVLWFDSLIVVALIPQSLYINMKSLILETY